MRWSELSEVSVGAQIADDVEIGPFTVVHDGVVIGAGTRIGSHCVIGHSGPVGGSSQLVIGERSIVRSHTVLYSGSTFGPELETGHHVTIREGTRAGINWRVGTLSDIQGDVVIGDYVRLHSNVHLGKLSVLGSFVWIFPYVVLTNDPTPPSDHDQHVGVTVGDFAVVATMSCIAPGITIGEDSLVAAMSVVTKDVPAGMVVRGHPARVVGPAEDVILRDGSERPAYPWRSHFFRGYPGEVVESWESSR